MTSTSTAARPEKRATTPVAFAASGRTATRITIKPPSQVLAHTTWTVSLIVAKARPDPAAA